MENEKIDMVEFHINMEKFKKSFSILKSFCSKLKEALKDDISSSENNAEKLNSDGKNSK